MGDAQSDFKYKLLRACSATKVRTAAAAYVSEGRVLAATTEAIFSSPTTVYEDTPFGIACVVKGITASLLYPLFARGDFHLHGKTSESLEVSTEEAARYFNNITFAQLLSHSHGLPLYFLDARTVPYDTRQRIDSAEICRVLAESRVDVRSRQSRFCYGNVGFLLLGSVLEKKLGAPFGEILAENLLNYICSGDLRKVSRPNVACPSTGLGVSLSIRDVGNLLSFLLDPARFSVPYFGSIGSFSELFERQLSFPGWAPHACGMCLGWEFFGGGWVGHYGSSGGLSLTVQLNLKQRTALAFCAASDDGYGFEAGLHAMFGSFFAHHTIGRPPRKLPMSAWEDIDAQPYVGAYGNDFRTMRVAIEGSAVTLDVVERIDMGGTIDESFQSSLHPGVNNCAYYRAPNGNGFQQCQFVDFDGRRFRSIWDGEFLWDRK